MLILLISPEGKHPLLIFICNSEMGTQLYCVGFPVLQVSSLSDCGSSSLHLKVPKNLSLYLHENRIVLEQSKNKMRMLSKVV